MLAKALRLRQQTLQDWVLVLRKYYQEALLGQLYLYYDVCLWGSTIHFNDETKVLMSCYNSNLF